MRFLWMVLLFVSLSAHAESYRWKRVAQVDEVAITVHVVSFTELRELQLKHGDRTMYRGYSGKGLSLLFRDRDTKLYRCEVYVRDVNDKDTLEHETRHCHGWSH